jgi:hypothetical protein
MLRFAILICAFGWTFLPHIPGAWAEDDAHTSALVNQLQNDSDPAGASTAFVELRKVLGNSPRETIVPLQDRLCDAMWISDDPLAIRRIALMLAAAPSEQAILVFAQRLAQDPSPAITKAVCDGIHAFADQRPSLSAATIALALERLEAIARNGRLPGPVVDSAVMALATFGSAGFEELTKLGSDPFSTNKIRNVLFAAMGETDDPRALAALRAVARDLSVAEGRRIQAMHSLGQIFSRAADRGRPIDATERTPCVDELKRLLKEVVSDGMFAATLVAVGHLVSLEQDQDLQQEVLAALDAMGAARREAALDVLFQQDSPVTSAALSRVREIIESDANSGLRCTARAVLDKQEAIQATIPSDAE